MTKNRKILLGLLAASGLLAFSPAAPAQDAGAVTPANLTPPPADPHYLEGVWKPGGGGGPPPQAPGGKPGAGPAAGGPPGGGPPGGGGGGRRPETPDQIAGSQLVCAPDSSLLGGGGGTSTLWIEGAHEIVIIDEATQDFRQIFLQSRHPKNLTPQLIGNSIGHWDGNTLLVDTIGFADKNGKPIDQHIVERITKQGKTLIDHASITLNGVTTQQDLTADWRPDLQVWENVCEEGYSKFQLVNGQVDDVNN